MKDNIHGKPGEGETHYTCTSTPLEKTPESEKEYISTVILNEEYERQTGTKVSSDPIVRVIQHEQTIRRSKTKD